MKKIHKNGSKLSHKSETVRALSGREMTTAAGGKPKYPQGPDTCATGPSCSHTCYYCQTTDNDW